MPFPLFGVLLLAAALPAAPAGDPAEALAEARRVVEVVHRLENRYREMGSFRLDFVQRYVSSAFGMEDEQQQGTILVRCPDRMRIDYSRPPGQYALFDGATWWLIEPDEQTVTRAQRGKGEGNPLLDLLSGTTDLLRLFAARPDSRPGPRGRIRLLLLPREEREDIETLMLEIETRTGNLRRAEVVGPLGGRMIYVFEPPRPVPPPGDEDFRVTIPPGYLLLDG
ncbi:MAG: outer membrane lipoprotein carrier protein LolA [Acidobacteriota bacterium]|nr:outer membrane lipoprotein carrier protein LolA [Acidobacteriota bacterium]